MIGITIPDAVLISTLVISLVAVWRGTTQGDAAKKQTIQSAPMVKIATGIVEANQFADYMKVQDKLAIAIDKHADALNRQHEVKHTNALEDLAEKIDEALDAGASAPTQIVGPPR
jgi:hypothetical protein